MMQRLRVLTLWQILGLMLLWPVALLALALLTMLAMLGREGGVSPTGEYAVHFQVFATGWILLFGPPAALFLFWSLSRNRARRQRP